MIDKDNLRQYKDQPRVNPNTQWDKGINPNTQWDKYPTQEEMVNHPNHYGGRNNPYEAIKVIEAWDLGFNLGNAVKYISRADKKGNKLQDLEKSSWYINREINKLKNK